MKKAFSIILTLSIILTIAGVGLIAYPKLTDWGYAVYQKGLELSSGDAEATEGKISLPDEAVAKIIIPKIGLDAYVLSGTEPAVLKKGPSHYKDTPLPGEDGNLAIAGHRTMYGHPFRYLDKLSQGDEIFIYTEDGKYIYRVAQKKTVRPTDLSVIEPTEESILTLTTCHPVGSAKQRLVIIAQLEEG